MLYSCSFVILSLVYHVSLYFHFRHFLVHCRECNEHTSSCFYICNRGIRNVDIVFLYEVHLSIEPSIHVEVQNLKRFRSCSRIVSVVQPYAYSVILFFHIVRNICSHRQISSHVFFQMLVVYPNINHVHSTFKLDEIFLLFAEV